MEVANPGPRPEKSIEIYEFEGYDHYLRSLQFMLLFAV